MSSLSAQSCGVQFAIQSKLSTGLAEFLIDRKSYDDNLKDRNLTFDFDVCGLVTNICVVSSCVSGTNILNQYLFKPLRSDVKLIDYRFNILNEYCVNLTLPHRNAQKIINTFLVAYLKK